MSQENAEGAQGEIVSNSEQGDEQSQAKSGTVKNGTGTHRQDSDPSAEHRLNERASALAVTMKVSEADLKRCISLAHLVQLSKKNLLIELGHCLKLPACSLQDFKKWRDDNGSNASYWALVKAALENDKETVARKVCSLLHDIPVLTIEELQLETGISNEELCLPVEDTDIHLVAGCFDSAAEHYLIGLQLKRIQRTTVKQTTQTSHQEAMEQALEMWRERNTCAATFEVLIRMLVEDRKGDAARQLCMYLKQKVLQSNKKGGDGLKIPQFRVQVNNDRVHSGRRKKACFCVSTVVCCALMISFAAVTTVFVAHGASYSLHSTSVYAVGGHTVIAAEFSNPSPFVLNTISECPDTSDDYPHSNHLYLVESTQLIRKKQFVQESEDILNQTSANCMTNLIIDGDLYLLKDSTIDFNICIAADRNSERPGTLLIFDNNAAYEQYITDGNCESVRGAHTHNLNIGSFGAFECTSISTYVSSVNGYHYIIANTPGNIRFYYNYSYEQYYLDPNDFIAPAVCSFSSEGDNLCTFNDVTPEKVYAIVSVDPSEVDNSISTHICVGSQWTHRLTALVVCFGVLFLICSVLFVVSLSVCLHLCRYRRNPTYVRLRQSSTSSK